MIQPLRRFWALSLRRRMLAGGVGLFALTLLLASALQYAQFQRFVDTRAQSRVLALAENFAVSSRVWVLSNDLAGLQEMARAMQDFPDVRYAMLIAPDGRVLAHNQAEYDGRYLSDPASLALLRDKPVARMLPAGLGMMDAAAPIRVGDHLVGWARVGVSLEYLREFRDQVVVNMALLLLFSTLAGGFALWWLTGGLMRGIGRLMQGMRSLEAGAHGRELIEVRGHDELARLAQAFNELSTTLDERERALRESEARWQFALEGSDLGVWDWDVDCSKVYFSPRWKSILGYQDAEIGDDFLEWESRIHPADLTACLADLDRHLLGVTPTYRNEHRLRAKDGSWRLILVRGKVIERDSAGKPLRVIGTHLDVTERRAAEAERAQLQQQLQHAQKLEAIGQLTGGIAHDFNNILGAILGYTSLTLDRYAAELPDKARGYLAEVQKAGERARDLIQKMLAFARGGGGEAVLLDPSPLVREVIKMLCGTLPSSLEVVERINPDVPSIRIDPVHLHQMLTNLVINARDATGGEGHIEVGLRRSRFSGEASGEVCVINHLPVRGEFVELYVKDDGSGIAADALPKIFDPFFTTKEVGKGSGMGLAMVLGILRENDGHVLVQTRTGAGHGTCFRLLFQPVAGVAPVPAELPAAPPVAAAGGRQILVVDDEAPLGRLLGEVLEANGYQATVLANPRAALVAFRADPDAFHAVITDQTMPRMTGLELTHELLAINPKLPVFMVSGYSDKVDAESARHHGVRRFFHKPVDQAALLEALREV